MKKYIWLLPIFSGCLCSSWVWKRELWFDEALTLLNFVLPLDWLQIYLTYPIPNNHIVYSILLKIWDYCYCGGVDIVVFWRMLSTCCAVGMLGIVLYLRKQLDNGKSYPAILTLTAMSVSLIFANYATALRGYAAGWLFIALALLGLYNIFHERVRSGWVIYCTGSLLAVGTVPTNLLPLAGAVIYAVAWMPEKFYKNWRFYAIAAVLPLSLIVFYLPIAGAFLNTLKLGEGFASRSGALAVTLGMYLACFGLLFIFALLGNCQQRKNWQYDLRWLIWLLPAAAVGLLHRAPFPRVFVTLLPVLAMLVMDGIAVVTGKSWRNFHKAIFFMLVLCTQILLIPGGMLAAEKLQLSKYEDDFFHPWYMLPRYRATAAVQLLQEQRADRVIFISFAADPLPVLFYAMNMNVQREFRCDVPFNSVQQLPRGAILLLRCDESAEHYAKRFNGTLRKLSGNRQYGLFELY